MVRIKIFIFLILLSLCVNSFAQSSNILKDTLEFNTGLSLYNASKFSDAQKVFSGIINSQPFNSNTTIAFLFDGKSLLALKKYNEALNILEDFINKFPQSNYIDEAKSTIAEIYFLQKNYYAALTELNSLIESTNSPDYDSYAKTTGQRLAENFLTISQIKNLYDSTSSIKVKPYLLLTLGKMYLDKGQPNQAQNTFAELLKLYPNSEEKNDAAVYYQHIMNEKQINPSLPLIGVMLPLTKVGEDAANASSEILEGIKFAVDKYNQEHNPKIGILIRDTERKNSKIEVIKNEFEHINSVRAIIGPIYSDEVKEALKDFDDTDIPIISPTATDDNLTEINKNFFQANLSFSMRGKVMADYIFYVENKKKMGVLNATTGYSPILAKSFIDEFQKLGGQIIVQQTYDVDSTSFSRQIFQITQDSSQIEGIYLPLSDKNDVPVILSQFAQFNLNAPIYGNQDWFLAKGYESYPALSNKLTFTSDYFIDYSDSSLEIFSRKFLRQTNINVDRNVLYGYDVANYLLPLVDESLSRSDLEKNILSGGIYKGFHNDIFFNKDRLNCIMNIVRYRNGKFELVDKFKAAK